MHKERETIKFWSHIRLAHTMLYVLVVLVIVALGMYENLLSLSHWLSGLAFRYDVSIPALLARELTTAIVIYALYSVMSFFGYWPLFLLSRYFEFPSGSFYDKKTFIYYRKQVDYEKINEGFKRLTRALLLLFATLLPMLFLSGNVRYLSAAIVAWLMLTGFVKVMSGKRQKDGDVSYYPQSDEFRSIATDAWMGTESDEGMIKKIERLPDDCPDMEIALLLKRRLLGEEVSMPFSHYGFGTPELDEEELRALESADEEPKRRG